MAKIKYITRREYYQQHLEELAELLPLLRRAASDFADGKIQAYQLSHHNISRNFASLKDLLDYLRQVELEYEELDNVLHGRSRRQVDHCVYVNPTNVRLY